MRSVSVGWLSPVCAGPSSAERWCNADFNGLGELLVVNTGQDGVEFPSGVVVSGAFPEDMLEGMFGTAGSASVIEFFTHFAEVVLGPHCSRLDATKYVGLVVCECALVHGGDGGLGGDLAGVSVVHSCALD